MRYPCYILELVTEPHIVQGAWNQAYSIALLFTLFLQPHVHLYFYLWFQSKGNSNWSKNRNLFAGSASFWSEQNTKTITCRLGGSKSIQFLRVITNTNTYCSFIKRHGKKNSYLWYTVHTGATLVSNKSELIDRCLHAMLISTY